MKLWYHYPVMPDVMPDAPAAQPHLALYFSRFCGYCYRVLSAIEELGIAVDLRDVTLHKSLRDDIITATGRRTVPVLKIVHETGREEWMFESRAIISYLEELSNPR